MTLPDLLQSIALIAVSIGIVLTGAEIPGFIALALVIVAFIIKTDERPRWRK